MTARWVLLAVLAGCVNAPPYRPCADPCGRGQGCDTSIGQCHDDPCEGRCSRGEHCDPGPPAVCLINPVGRWEPIPSPSGDGSSDVGMMH